MVDWKKARKATLLGGPVAGLASVADDQWFGGGGKKALRNIDPADHEGRRKAEAEADQLQREGVSIYDNITPAEALEELSAGPDLTYANRYTPNLLTQGEQYDPALLTGDYQLGDSKFGDIAVNEKFLEAQNSALGGVQDIVDSEGLTAMDRANLAKIESQAGRADRGRREAIQDRMRRQGMAGSGLDLLAQLQSAQSATDAQSQRGLDVAAMGQQRKENALRDLGSMGTSMRSQDFGEQARKAEAADRIAAANMQYTYDRDRYNTDTQNQGQQYNINRNDDVRYRNTDMRNDAQRFNLSRDDDRTLRNWTRGNYLRDSNTDIRNQNKRNAYEDDLNVRDKRYNATANFANYQGNKSNQIANRNAQTYSGILDTGSAAASSLVGMPPGSDEDLKKDVTILSSSDIEQFLEAVKPKKYKYKDKKEGPGIRVGFMAQDIENNPIGEAIVQEDEEGTKRIDNFNLMGALLDSVSHLHKKQKKMEKK